MKKLLVPAVILLLLFITFAFTNGKSKKIRIADIRQPVSILMHITADRGFARKEGLDAEFKIFSVGKDALTDVLEGNSDIAVVYNTPISQKLLEGADISVISSVGLISGGTVIVSKKEVIPDIYDLANKRIALEKGTSSEFFFHSSLQTLDREIPGYIIADVKTPEILGKIESGEVEAGVVFYPFTAEIKDKFKEEVKVFENDFYYDSVMLVGKREYIEKSGDNLVRLLKALKKAEIYFNSNRDDAYGIESAISGLDAEELEDFYEGVNVKLGFDNRMELILWNP